jgi:hypothetical protein
MKEVIQLSEDVKAASKFLYRLKYVRDIMLHPTIDDPGVTAINSMITFTSGEICSKVISEERYMNELFLVIYPKIMKELKARFPTTVDPTIQSFSESYIQQEKLPNSFHGVVFLKELINLSKFMSYDRRVELFKSFFSTYREIFLKILLFVLHGASRSLHYRISAVPGALQTRTASLNVQSNSVSSISTLGMGSPVGQNLAHFKKEDSACSVPSTVDAHLSTRENSYGLETILNNDESFEQETVKDNITERQESSDSNDDAMMQSIPFDFLNEENYSFMYEELFTHQQSLETINHIADIISTIAFTYPSLLRQAILEGKHPFQNTSDVSAHSLSLLATFDTDVPLPLKQENCSVSDSNDLSWMENSLLFLLIDNIINGKEITTIELFGESLKAIIDFDKQLNSPMATQSHSMNPLHNSNSNAIFLNQIKSEKEYFLPVFYDKYFMWLLAPYCDNNQPFHSVGNSYYSQKGVSFLPSVLQNSSHPPTPLPTTFTFCPTSFPKRRTVLEIGSPKILPSAFSLENNTKQSSFALITSRRLIMEICMICISTHSYRIKYILIKGNHITRIINKSLSSEPGSFTSGGVVNISTGPQSCKSLQLYSIKFLKCILLTKDEFYYRHLEKMDCFKGIIFLLQKVSTRDNLISSAIFDLVELIRNESITILIFYLMKKYASVFDELVLYNSVDCFDKLKLKYLQLKEKEENPSLFESSPLDNLTGRSDADETKKSPSIQTRKRSHVVTSSVQLKKMNELDDEEDYFNDSDEAEEGEEELHSDENEETDSRIDSIRSSSDDSQPSKKLRVLSPLSLEAHEASLSCSSSPLSPRFLETLRYKTVPSKPVSPPHYSQRKHGSPLDGESPSNSYRHSPTLSIPLRKPPITSIAHNSNFTKRNDDVFSLLSVYDDHSENEDENQMKEELRRSGDSESKLSDREESRIFFEENETVTLPPIRSRTIDDEDMIASVFSKVNATPAYMANGRGNTKVNGENEEAKHSLTFPMSIVKKKIVSLFYSSKLSFFTLICRKIINRLVARLKVPCAVLALFSLF